jgi:hypothetical protein
MWNRLHLALLLALALPAASAFADIIYSNAPPEFTADEQAVIHRNAALNQLMGADGDPWLVRRVLDEIAATKSGTARELVSGSASHRKVERPPQPECNPDLDDLARSSPEASHDLLLLIRKAAGGVKRSTTC